MMIMMISFIYSSVEEASEMLEKESNRC